MRKRALRLLLLGPQGRFWRHTTHSLRRTGQQNFLSSRPHVAACEIATSALAEVGGSYFTPATISADVAAAIPASLSSARTAKSLGPLASLFACESHGRTASSLAEYCRSLNGAPPLPAAIATSTAPVGTQIRRRSCGCQTASAAPSIGAAVAWREFSSVGPRILSYSERRRRVQTAVVDASAAGRRPGGALNDLHSLEAGEGRHANPNHGGRVEPRVKGSAPTAAATTAASPGPIEDLRSIARGGPAASGPLVYPSGSLRDQLSDVLTAARQAARSRSTHLRRRAAARLLAWLGRKPDACEAMAASSPGALPLAALPAPAASELAALCCEFSITDKAVWDRLLDMVAGNAAAAVGGAAADGSIQLTEYEQRRSSVVRAWEYALVLRAAAVCGRHVTDHPQLYVLQQALSTSTHRCLFPVPLRRDVQEGGSPSLQDPWCTSGLGRRAGEGQSPDGILGLAALLHAAGELSSLPGGTKQLAESVATPAAARSRTILLQAGVAEAALRELLLTVARPLSFTVGGILTNTTLGAAASLRAVLVAWRLLADGALRAPAAVAGPSGPLPAATTPVPVTAAAVVSTAAPFAISLDVELIQQVAHFVETSTNLLLPEARSDIGTDTDGGNVNGGGGGGGSSSSSSSSNARVIQQLALAWRSGPDLHRQPGLSKAVWDALLVTANLAAPGVPWVTGASIAAPGGSDVLGTDKISTSSAAASSASLPAPAAAVAPELLLLSELCRLAAATFYPRTDLLDSDGAAKSGLPGNVGTRRRSRSSSSAVDSYSPSADDLLMLIRVVEALRGQFAGAAAATGSDRTAAGPASAGAGELLEAIVLASSSAYLRRVTGLLSWGEGQSPAGSAVGCGDEEEDMLRLPVSALITEYLARRSRIPDWHLIWRLLRHQNTAAAAVTAAVRSPSVSLPPLASTPDAERDAAVVTYPPSEAAAWAAHAAAAVAARVLRSSDEELRRWCWPRTAVRVAEMLAESLRTRSLEASANRDGTGSCAGGWTLLPAAAVVAAAERLLLHAAPMIAAPKPEFAAALAWLRGAAVLGGSRLRHGEGSGADSPFPAVLGEMAALAEVLLMQLKQQQQLQHQGAVAAALDWALDALPDTVDSPNNSEGQNRGSSSNSSSSTTTVTTATFCGSFQEGLTTNDRGHEGRAGARLGTSGGVSTVLQAIGELLEVDAREPEEHLPVSLLEGALELLVAAAEATAVAAERRKRLSPWDGPPQASVAGSDADGTGGVVLARAAVQGLGWLASRQVVPGPEILSPLLKAVTAPAAEWLMQGEGPRRKTFPETANAGLRKEAVAGGMQQLLLRQQQLAEATLAVASLVDFAAAEEGRADVLPHLHEAARQLAATLQRAPPYRFPLLQLAALCGALWRLGLMGPSLLLHLTQLQRRPHVAMYNVNNNEGGGGGPSAAAAAVAASQLLQLAAAVLCPASPPWTDVDMGGGGSPALGFTTTTTTVATTTTAATAATTTTTTAAATAAAVATVSASATAASRANDQLAEASADLVSWLLPLLCRDVEAVPSEQLVASWCAARDLATARDGGANAVGTAARGGSGTADDGVRPRKSSDRWLQTLGAVATRRLLMVGVDGLLLHQLAALSRCLGEPTTSVTSVTSSPHSDLFRRDHGKYSSTSELRSETIEAPTAGATTPQFSDSHTNVWHTAGWLSRWLQSHPQCLDRTPRPMYVSSSPAEGGGTPHSDDDCTTSAALPRAVAVMPPAELDAVTPRPAVQLTPAAEELQQQQRQQRQRLQQQVLEALLQRTTRHGDAYEAPVDIACGAFRDLAAAGVLRASQPLAASLVEGLVFRLAEDAGIDGLSAVAAALAAGVADPWVGHCAARGLLDELATGLQRRLRLQPEEVTTAHLVTVAADMYHVSTATTGVGAAATVAAAATATESQAGITAAAAAGAWLSAAAVLRVLSRALAARAEYLLPDQVLFVAAMFSPPRLRDTHLLQRLTEAAAAAVTVPAPTASAPASERRVYTAEQLLRLAQCLYSAGIRDQQLFAPLARALRVRTAVSAAAASASASAGAGSGNGDDVNARTLQAAAGLLRAVRLHADADALQQAFVVRMRAGGGPQA